MISYVKHKLLTFNKQVIKSAWT